MTAAIGLKIKVKPSLNESNHESLSLRRGLVDQLDAMMSQDEKYMCTDYLSRYRSMMDQNMVHTELMESVDGQLVDAVCREKMCEWAYRVGDHFGTDRKVVGFAFSYLDRFMECYDCNRSLFKLVTMTCMYMAAKVFNTNKISMKSLVQLSKGEFEECQMAETELLILETIGWHLPAPTALCFVGIFTSGLQSLFKEHKISACVKTRADFFAELAVYDYHFVSINKGIVAVCAVLNAIEGLGEEMDVVKYQSHFLGTVRNVFGLSYEQSDLHYIQQRLWCLYTMSAQCGDDEALPSVLDTPGEQNSHFVIQKHLGTSIEVSPVCVQSGCWK